MVRPTGWDILGLDGDPTPGVVESVQALAKEFGDFAHDVESAYRSLNSFGSDANALQWVGQTAEAFKGQFGPLPGRLQKLYTSYSEASDALSAYAPLLQAAQSKADSALRQAQDAQVDLQRATTNANTAATDLKTAQQNHAANPDQQAVTAAQTTHDTAQSNLNNAKARMADLTRQAHDAYNDRINAAKTCATALHHAQSDGIHNKHWWEHVGEFLSEWGGKIAEIANDLAPFLDVLAIATSWIPGVDVVTAALAEADNIIALVGSGMQLAGDAMQGHWGDALLDAGMLGASYLGGRLVKKLGTRGCTKAGDPVDVVSGQMITDDTDLSLPGVLPLVLRRAYKSGYDTGRLFGPGWSATIDQRVAVNVAGIHFLGDDAQQLDYPLPDEGAAVVPAEGARWPLVWNREGGTDEIRITDPESGQILHFGTVHHRDPRGEIRDLTAVSDRNGNRVDIVRDENGTPTLLEHTAGYRVAIDTATGASGIRVTGIRLLDGTEHGVVVRQFTYDERGRLAGIVDSSGVAFRYEHDGADRITAWIDRVGYRYAYEYGPDGRVARGAGNDGFLSATFDYDLEARLTTVTDARGGTIRYRYNADYYLSAVTDQLGHTTVFERDRHGRLLAQTDALGHATRYDLDHDGNTVAVHRPDGSSSTARYNLFGQTVELVEGDGATWHFEYDDRGNSIAATDPLGHTTYRTFDERGRLLTQTDAAGNVTRYGCDDAGLAVMERDGLGAETTFTRDAFGRVVAVTDPMGEVTRFDWTVEGYLSRREDPDGSLFTWTYDAESELVSQVDPLGNVTAFENGPFGKVLARTDPDGSRHLFGYDRELNLVSVTNPAGAIWRYDYDPRHNIVGETDFAGRTVGYRFDAVGRMTARIGADGRQVELQLDPMGRIVRRVGAGVSEFDYDPAGRMVSARNIAADVRFTHDGAGRIVGESVNGREVLTRYDVLGNVIERSTPGGAVSGWRFDAVGRPVELTAGAHGLTFEHDAGGRQTGLAIGSSARMALSYDAVGQLTRQRIEIAARAGTDSSALLLDREYSYRADGIPTTVAENSTGVRTYQSDASGRVVSVQAPGWTEAYAYDAFGNLAFSSRPGDDNRSGALEHEATAVVRAGRTLYERDSRGRTTRVVQRLLSGQRRIWTYSWDVEDRLVQATLPDGTVWQYAYDAFGRRVAKSRLHADGAVAEQIAFAWDGDLLVEQTVRDEDGRISSLVWDYEPDSGRPLVQRRRQWAAEAPQEVIDEAFHAIVTDLVGAPTELLAGDGRIAWRLTSSLFGSTIALAADPDTDCPLRFPGQYRDSETGLHYNHQRYYDPDTAAYLTPDPLGLIPAPNDQAYVDNPMVASDPMGLAPKIPRVGSARWKYLDRPGFSNYVLIEKVNGVDRVYYSGMFGPGQTEGDVKYRHSNNHNRFSEANGDRIQVEPGTRTYGHARLREQELNDLHGTFIGKDGVNYRGNRQNPMKAAKRAEYKGYAAKKAKLCV